MILIGFSILTAILIYFLFFTKAKVSVEVVPTSAVVTLDNKPSAITNGSASFVTSLGKHTLRVEADNYIGYKQEVNLSRGRNFSKSITLTKAPTPVKIAENAQYVAISGDNVFYFNPTDKLFYLAKIHYITGGQAEVASAQAITSKPLVSFDKIIWSPNCELVAIKRGTSVSVLDFKKYDFVHQNEISFGNNIGDIAWSPDNSRLAYYYAPPSGEKSLIFSDANNQNITRVVNFAEAGIENPFLAFSPSSEYLTIVPRNQNFDQNKIYLLNVYTRTITPSNSAGNQKEALFSADSKKIIYSTYSDNQQNPVRQILSVMDLNFSNSKSLGIAAKATDIRLWQNFDQIFLPVNSTRSKMMVVDLNTGQTSEFYFTGQSDSNISEVALNGQKNAAIFVSKSILYFVKLEGNG